MQITYQKRDGSVMQKYRKWPPPYEIGETTSMGWTVLNIEYEYKGKYYPELQYNLIFVKKRRNYILKKQIKKHITSWSKSLLYIIMILIILYHIKIRIGI